MLKDDLTGQMARVHSLSILHDQKKEKPGEGDPESEVEINDLIKKFNVTVNKTDKNISFVKCQLKKRRCLGC